MKICFRGSLTDLLYHRYRGKEQFVLTASRRASIKDVIESFGIPHTEIGKILASKEEVDFSYIATDESTCIEVFPLEYPVNPLLPSILRPGPLPAIGFIVDVNVGKLASLLRMAGFDTVYDPQMNDEQLAETASNQGRILLSRDKHLLKRKIVTYGCLIRHIHPEEQLLEVVEKYGLKNKLRPFSRCIVCNGQLLQVSKKEILSELEPLTKKYYQNFHRCDCCQKIYWDGSHKKKMNALITFISNLVL